MGDEFVIEPVVLDKLMKNRAIERRVATRPDGQMQIGGAGNGRETRVNHNELRPEIARTMLGANCARVLNHYGPTETTVGVLTFEATSKSMDAAAALGAQSVPLGRPLSNTSVYVVDANGREQPVGVPGELVIGGMQPVQLPKRWARGLQPHDGTAGIAFAHTQTRALDAPSRLRGTVLGALCRQPAGHS